MTKPPETDLSRQPGIGRPLLSLDMLCSALSDEIDFWSDDDIEYAPEAEVLAQLRAIGDPRGAQTSRESTHSERPSGRESNPEVGVPPSWSWIRRDDAVDQLLLTLKSGHTLVTGAAGVGKSFFVNRLFAADPRVRAFYPRCALIDCSALRMRSSVLFEREAVWALFGTRDDAFRRFLGQCAWSREKGPLISFLEHKFEAPGLVVFDHVEYLDRHGCIDSWLSEKLLPAVDRQGGRVIFCSRTPETAKPLHSLQELSSISLSTLSEVEIGAWLENPTFAAHRVMGLTASEVMAATGGSPSLLRDLGIFLTYEPQSADDPPPVYGLEALRAFAHLEAQYGYITECERYLRAAWRHPQILFSGLDGLHVRHARQSAESKFYDRILASGAVREGPDGRLQFLSPIHDQRIKLLTRQDNLARLLLSADLPTLDRMGELKQLRRWAEIASGPLARALDSERNPQVALKRVREFLYRWGFQASIHVRDPDNARLWCIHDAVDHLMALSSFERPEFARAAQTGQPTSDVDGRLFLPLTGNSGLVEMVLSGTFRQKPGHLRRNTDIDRLCGIIRSLHPVLAQTLERFAFHRRRQFRERVLETTRRGDAGGGRLAVTSSLRAASCAALAVLERSPNPNGWFVLRFEVIADEVPPPGSESTALETKPTIFFDAKWAEPSDVQRLDAIAAHPSGRGLVLCGEAAFAVFPRLRSRYAAIKPKAFRGSDSADWVRDIAIYLQPVWIHDRRACRLVAFLFDEQVLNGQLQTHLSAIAPDVLDGPLLTRQGRHPTVRFSDEEHAALVARASRVGMTVGAYLRHTLEFVPDQTGTEPLVMEDANVRPRRN